MTNPTQSDVQAIFKFNRYINGQLMAEGVTIEREANLQAAMLAAVRLASRGPNGETPILVLVDHADALAKAL